MHYKKISLAVSLALSFVGWTQDTLVLTQQSAEKIFLEKNLSILAQQLHINQQEARIEQAKLWPNPTVTFDQVNFWAGPKQTLGQETAPPLWNDFGRNQQFALELEQLVYTANKRQKWVELEKISADKEKIYFSELLRVLKFELRNNINELYFDRQTLLRYQNLELGLEDQIKRFKSQVQQGNIASKEYLRLRSTQISIQKKIHEIQFNLLNAEKELKNLLHLPETVTLKIEENPLAIEHIERFKELALFQLREHFEQRPDFQIMELDQKYSEQQYLIERAKRYSDLTIKANYDRNGSTMLNFIGFGVSFDLPVFNRNQGNIKVAQLDVQQQQLRKQMLLNESTNELFALYKKTNNSVELLEKLDIQFQDELAQILGAYTRNFESRNIGLVEYIDFIESFLENQEIIFDAQKALYFEFQQLNYILGKEII